MTNYLRALVERTEEVGPVRFVASTEGVKRDGKDLKVEDWDLTNFKRNPVVLINHDYRSLPIGRAEMTVDGKRLLADVTFDDQDELAVKVESKIKRGIITSGSVGWEDLPGGKRDLLDFSIVTVPADTSATVERNVRGLVDTLHEYLRDISDEPDTPGGDAEAVWEGTALQMARLFVSAANDGFDQRAYRRLSRTYQRLGKTAPEVPDHLDAMGVTEIRGLFLAGEPDLVPELFAEPVIVPAQPDAALVRLHELMTIGAR